MGRRDEYDNWACAFRYSISEGVNLKIKMDRLWINTTFHMLYLTAQGSGAVFLISTHMLSLRDNFNEQRSVNQ